MRGFIKFFGATLTALSFSLLGIYKSYKLKERNKTLIDFEIALNYLETDIESSILTLPKAFSNINCKYVKDAFNNASKLMKKGKTADEALLMSIHLFKGLKKEDENTIISFAKGLLSLEKVGQLKNISHTRERIKKLRMESEEECKKEGKLYKSGGILLGLIISIILY